MYHPSSSDLSCTSLGYLLLLLQVVLWYLQYLLLQKYLCINICLHSSGWTILADPRYNGTKSFSSIILVSGSSGVSLANRRPLVLARSFCSLRSGALTWGIGMYGNGMSSSHTRSSPVCRMSSSWAIAPLAMRCFSCASLFNAFQL